MKRALPASLYAAGNWPIVLAGTRSRPSGLETGSAPRRIRASSRCSGSAALSAPERRSSTRSFRIPTASRKSFESNVTQIAAIRSRPKAFANECVVVASFAADRELPVMSIEAKDAHLKSVDTAGELSRVQRQVPPERWVAHPLLELACAIGQCLETRVALPHLLEPALSQRLERRARQ